MSENGEIRGKTIEETSEDLSALTKQLVTDPELLEKFGKKLMSFVGKSSGYLESLPKSVKRRVRALRKLQMEVFKVESKFYEEVHKLEAKYADLYMPLYNKRSNIVNGITEPTDSECEWESDDEHDCKNEAGDCCDHEAEQGHADQPDLVKPVYDEKTKGIPLFWYTTLKNNDVIDQLIMSHDEEALKTLQDIRVTYNKEEESEMYFELHFGFDANPFFENEVLTKRYHLKVEPSPSFPLNYEGPEIVKTTGCTINWKAGMKLTSVDDVKKINSEVNEKEFSSFFSFFETSHESDSSKDLNESAQVSKENEQILDFEIGQLLQSSVIPRAILHFTGEIAGDEDEEDYEDDGEGEYDEDEDPDYAPKGKSGGNECKQQ